MKKKNDIAIRSCAEYLIYIAATGDDSQSFEMRYEREYLANTKMLAALYDVEVPTVNEHNKKIFSDHELQEEATIRKFRIVQTEVNKLHWAIHGQTAAEVIYKRADAEKKHMGLTNWKDAPNGKIQKFDVGCEELFK